MSATNARVGRGTTLTEKSTGSHVAIAEMVKLTPYEMDTGAVDATHLTSDNNAKEFIAGGFIDYGMVEFIANYKSSEVDRMNTILEAQALVEWKFTVPDKLNGTGTNTIVTLNGILQKFKGIDEASVDQNAPMRSSASIKISGKVTFAKATAGV